MISMRFSSCIVTVAIAHPDIITLPLIPVRFTLLLHFLLLTGYRAAYNFTQAQSEDLIRIQTGKPRREMMNTNQIMYDLTYWFDFIILVVRHHPLVSVATVLVAFLFYQALSVMKL